MIEKNQALICKFFIFSEIATICSKLDATIVLDNKLVY